MERGGLSLSARYEVTRKYAQAYAAASKSDKGQILDQVVEVTGWNRDHARQQLTARLGKPPGRASMTVAVVDRRHAKPFKYSYDARKVLQTVWATSGGLCGKYLAVSMEGWLDAMEAEGSLVLGVGRCNGEGLSDGLCKWWSPDLKEIDCDHDQQEEPGAGVGSPPVAA